MKDYFYRLSAYMVQEYGLTIGGVYSYLLDACEEDEFRANRKVETIAKKLKLTTRAVISVINKLEKLGYVKRVKIGRRTVYDIVPVLPPKKRNENYMAEDYRQSDDTYRDMLRRIPNLVIRKHYQKMLEELGYNLDGKAYFTLRTIAANYQEKKNTQLWAERLRHHNLNEQQRLLDTTGMIKFTDYPKEEQEQFNLNRKE
ncbi:MAG: helix-turn-helix domain-containing protein [Oscillospiraceae bacterium]|nr:helix-turn-helix domain-containing protein [Oscillospiraceae bacterium]